MLMNHNRRQNWVFPRAFVPLAMVLILFLSSPSPATGEMKSVDLSTAIAKVAKQATPAVVAIEVTESREVANPLLPFENDPFLRRFFNTPKMPRKFKQEMKGMGSGMIIDAKGHILTNYHVAGGATKIQVVLADGDRYTAKLVGGDPRTDLAVISITPKQPLPFVTFGDSDKVEVGEWVIAIGSPRALEKTVTQGIISAKHRKGITDPSSYQDFLQTDAAINPGNSGGPLLNLYGEVIGVNAAIATESGGFEGIGFTIPSNMAVFVSKALIQTGKVERGWLGVSIRDLTPELAKSLNLENLRGALIADTVKGGPADKAGLKKNDVVVGFRGKEIQDSGTFRNEVGVTPIGEQAKITVLRDGKKQDLTVKIGSMEEGTKVIAREMREKYGIEVRALTSKEVEKYGLSPGQGVAVAWVDSKGSFGAAGFEVQDVILAIEEQPIMGVDGFVGVMSALKPNQKVSVMAVDHRTGRSGQVAVTLGAERHLGKARQSFLEKKSGDAAEEIGRGAESLRQEANRSTGKAKEILLASVRELEKLAQEVKKGAVSSVKKLDEAFNRAYQALTQD